MGDRRGQASALSNLASAYAAMGDERRAREAFDRALELYRTAPHRNAEAETLLAAARFERDRGNLAEARDRIERALAIKESLRAKIASDDLRSSYFAGARRHFDFHTSLLMRLHEQGPSEGYDALALQASERARARSLLDLLNEARADIRGGANPRLVDRKRALQQRFGAKAARHERLVGRRAPEEQVSAVRKEIAEIEVELRDLEGQIRATNPRYAALTQPVPLALARTQGLLDEETVLLEYSLGEERSHLWFVARRSFASFSLPGRDVIEREAVSAVRLLAEGGTPEEFEARAAELSRLLLGPVAPRLGRKRLLVVADGALQYLPFSALAAPGAAGRTRAYRPLIVEHEVANLPSASSLAVLRDDRASRPRPSGGVAILADPVFSANDERLRARPRAGPGGLAKAAEGESRDGPSSAASDGDREPEGVPWSAKDNLARLPETRSEAEQIAALVPARGARVFLDFDANLEAARSAEPGQYRIVHFATHGFLNPARPELSGLVLSLVDEKGEPREGFLSVPAVFNLTLPADLVVLSGCRTGLGKAVRGEGLVGLTRGFMYAGTPRVVASVWAVPDEATARLMAGFYRAMLARGMRPAAALREARIAMWRDPQWSDPAQWRSSPGSPRALVSSRPTSTRPQRARRGAKATRARISRGFSSTRSPTKTV
jgi:CHAT domain-containing protein